MSKEKSRLESFRPNLARAAFVLLSVLLLADLITLYVGLQKPVAQRTSHDTLIVVVLVLIAAGLFLTLLLLAFCHYLDRADGPLPPAPPARGQDSMSAEVESWEAGTSQVP